MSRSRRAACSSSGSDAAPHFQRPVAVSHLNTSDHDETSGTAGDLREKKYRPCSRVNDGLLRLLVSVSSEAKGPLVGTWDEVKPLPPSLGRMGISQTHRQQQARRLENSWPVAWPLIRSHDAALMSTLVIQVITFKWDFCLHKLKNLIHLTFWGLFWGYYDQVTKCEKWPISNKSVQNISLHRNLFQERRQRMSCDGSLICIFLKYLP